MNKNMGTKLSENEVLRALSSALKKHDISSDWYHIGGYKEEAVCMEKKQSQWIVYDGERGNQNHSEECVDLDVACHRLISRLSENDKIEEKITSSFQKNMENTTPTVTKKELVKLLSSRLEISDREIDSILGELPQVIGEELQAGKRVQLSGFGTFEVTNRAARVGRNPQTGEVIQIPATRSPRFKAGKALKDTVKR